MHFALTAICFILLFASKTERYFDLKRSCIFLCNFSFFLPYCGGEVVSEQIIIALFSFAGTLVGALAGVITTARLLNYRIEQLEKR